MNENETLPLFGANAMQTARLRRDGLNWNEWRCDQFPVERVRPAVIRTANAPAHDALAAEQSAAAVTTKIQVSVEAVLGAE